MTELAPYIAICLLVILLVWWAKYGRRRRSIVLRKGRRPWE